MLEKLTPVVDFIHILRAHLSYQIFGAKTSNPHYSFVIFGTKISYKNALEKRWWNWHLADIPLHPVSHKCIDWFAEKKEDNFLQKSFS